MYGQPEQWSMAPAFQPSKIVHTSSVGKSRFSYAVNDYRTGDVKSHEETRDGDCVQGSYSVIDADGYRRTVHYTAGPHTGFSAIVKREPVDSYQKQITPPQIIDHHNTVDSSYDLHNAHHHNNNQHILPDHQSTYNSPNSQHAENSHPTSYQSITFGNGHSTYLSTVHPIQSRSKWRNVSPATVNHHHASIMHGSSLQSARSGSGVDIDDAYWHSLGFTDVGVISAPKPILNDGAHATRFNYKSFDTHTHGPRSFISVHTPTGSYNY